MIDPISEILNEFHGEGLNQPEPVLPTTPDSVLLKRVLQLEETLQRLALISQAMYEVLGGGTDVNRQVLATKINEIDRRDGRLDGRYTPEPKACPSCDGMICLKFNRCLFCGHKAYTPNPFDTLH